MTGVRLVVVRCADWPAVVMAPAHDRPVAVLSANRVVSANAAARHHDVVVGLRRRDAQRRCPRLQLFPRDVEREARAFEPVATALDALTPRIEILEPGTCQFPVRGPSRYFGGDEEVARRCRTIVDGVVGSRTTVGVGVADGAFAAWCAAGRSLRSDDPLLVAPGGSPAFLAPFPIEALRIDDLTGLLRRLGITTLGSFAELPSRDVLGRFGDVGGSAHRLASGEDLQPPNLGDPPEDLAVATTFDPPVDRVDRAAFAAKSMADELGDALGARGMAPRVLLISAVFTDGTAVERRWRHTTNMGPSLVAQRVRWQLEGWLTAGGSDHDALTGGIVELMLRPLEVGGASGRQQQLWGGFDADGERALQAVARVQSLLGEGSVRVAEWKGGRGPADQYRLVPIDAVETDDGRLRSAVAAGEEPWPGRLPDPAPATVWSSPRPAALLDVDGEGVSVSRRGGMPPPDRLSVDGGPWRRVVRWCGPWLVEERWWDAVAARRRARVQVVLDDGSAHLLAAEDRRWWVEATYD